MDVGRLIWSLVAKLSKLDRQTTTTGLSVPLGLHLLADQLMSGSEIKQITDWAAGSCSFVFRWNEPYKKKVKLKTRDRIWRVPLHSLISLVSIVRSFVLLIVRATVHYPFSCGCLWSSHLIYLLLQYQQRERSTSTRYFIGVLTCIELAIDHTVDIETLMARCRSNDRNEMTN